MTDIEQRIEKSRADRRWSPPQHYKIDGTDNDAFDNLLGESVLIHDGLEEIASDLFELLHPSQSVDADAQQRFIQRIRAAGAEYGVWIHFPWSHQVVRYPHRDDHLKLRTYRNQYLVTRDEQESLYNKTIAVFGMSVGSNIVDQLVQSGIGSRYILSDFDILTPTNLNRVRSTMAQVGSRKVDCVAKKISEVDPFIDQIHVHDGYDRQTTPTLLDGCLPDLIVEEVDNLAAKAHIRKYASERSIPLVMATDLAEVSLLHVERYDQSGAKPFNGRVSPREYERMLTGELSPQELLKLHIKILGARNALSSSRFIESNLDIGTSLAGIPQLGSVATAGAALTDRCVREILLGRSLASGIYKLSAGTTLKAQRNSSRREHLRSILRLVRSMKSSTT